MRMYALSVVRSTIGGISFGNPCPDCESKNKSIKENQIPNNEGVSNEKI